MISKEWLTEATNTSQKLTNVQLVAITGLYHKTIANYWKLYGLPSCRESFTPLLDEELEQLVQEFKRERPESGLRYLQGFLSGKGLKIQRDRVQHCLQRVDALGQVLRRRSQIQRVPYHISGPNKVWHMDGHHKLIQWGIVFHGIVDGFWRTVRAVTHFQ